MGGPGQARILLVDDYVPFVRSLELALAPRYQVEVARSADEAFATLGRGRFDAVLCDVGLPGASGLELYQRVLAVAPDQARRFVFLTGGSTDEKTGRLLSALENPTMRKPFEL